MNIDITICHLVNITDSCAVWNILSSQLLVTNLYDNRFDFPITKFVEYECLYKPTSTFSAAHNGLRNKLRLEQRRSRFTCQTIAIEDLQDTEILKHSRQLGVGELSCIAFAKKINQVFLTDDQKARKIASQILGNDRVQTTAQLVGWLFYKNVLTDGDLENLIKDHTNNGRPLGKYFREVHAEAWRIKSLII